MIVLLDENFPLPLLDALLREGIDAEHIITLEQRGAPDRVIRTRVDQEPIVLLTNDTEFLMPPMPIAGWVIVSRVRQSRRLDDRINVWVRAIQKFLTTAPESRIHELMDDGQLLPWHDATSTDRESVSIPSTSKMVKVLGVDVASSSWASNGSALISFDADSRRFYSVDAPVIKWPGSRLTAVALATAINDYARSNGVRAVALDGPQGWRDPDTPAGLPGVGRRCEYECRTQGKTGVYPLTFPTSQRGWIEFCVDVFDALLEKSDVRLADPNGLRRPLAHGYIVLECFPTSAWRSSGLTALPAKAKRPLLREYAAPLAGAYDLPLALDRLGGHDDLQAIIAALVASAVVGGPGDAIACGTAAKTKTGDAAPPIRLEGYIWNVRPLGRSAIAEPTPARVSTSTRVTGPAVRVRQRVVNQVARGVTNQEQMVLKNLPGATSKNRIKIKLEIGNEEYELVVGDSHAAWRSQQDSTSLDSFDRLFALLSDDPERWWPAKLLDTD